MTKTTTYVVAGADAGSTPGVFVRVVSADAAEIVPGQRRILVKVLIENTSDSPMSLLFVYPVQEFDSTACL